MKKIIVTKVFGSHAQDQSRSMRAKELERLYGNLLDKARKKESVEIHKEAMEHIGNIVCRITVGRSFTEKNGEIESVHDLLTKSNGWKKMTVLAMFFFGHLEKLGISRLKNVMGVFIKFEELLERFLDEHKEKPNKDQSTDMMDVLLAVSEDKNAEYKITRNHIKEFLMELFVGGIDTSVNSIQWTMAEIIKNSIIIERLREEIDSVVGKSRLTGKCFKGFSHTMAHPLTLTPVPRLSIIDLETSLNLLT